MIFEGSRYEGSHLYYDAKNNINYLAPLDVQIDNVGEDLVYQMKAGDRLDLLAREFYGEAQLKWIILLANPQYFTEFEIEPGDILIIPNPERMVM